MSLSAIILILSNLIPLFGVVYLNWNLDLVMIIYWFENVIIGVSTLFKMNKAEGTNTMNMTVSGVARVASKRDVILFFSAHYGLFTFVHGVFILVLFGHPEVIPLLTFALIPPIISHTASYYINYIGNGEYLKVSASDLFFSPYKRIVPLHFTIILGAIFIKDGVQTIAPMVIFVIIKTLIDLYLHNLEHKKFSQSVI